MNAPSKWMVGVVAISLGLVIQAAQGPPCRRCARSGRWAGIRGCCKRRRHCGGNAECRERRSDWRFDLARQAGCARMGMAGQGVDESGHAAAALQQSQGAPAAGQNRHQLHDFLF
jgi:hypothetical protein